MSNTAKNLASEALNEVCTLSVSPDSFNSSVETWTLDAKLNPRLVDSLGYVPREKIIQRGIANGELLNAFRRSPSFLKQFDISGDESLGVMPDIQSMDEMDLQDFAIQNQEKINSISQKVQAQKAAAAAQVASESKPVENKEDA